MNNMFTAMLAAATAKVEVPVDGSTGVWIKQGAVVLSSGMKMTGATVSSGQTQFIYNRGIANSTVISSGGTMIVSSGGVATSTTIYSSGVVNVYGMLAVASAVEMAANVTVYSGGTVNDAYILLGTMLVSSGGLAEDVVASGLTTASRGVLNLRAGGSMNRVTLQRGENGFFNGQITNLLISGTGPVGYLRPPCIASGISVTSGTLVVNSGASGLAVTSGANATITVLDGGYIEYA